MTRVVGDRTAKILADRLELHTLGDLLRHYPRRYADRGELTDLATLADGEHVTVVAEVSRVSRRPMRNRKGDMLEVEVTDGTGGRLTLAFFGKGAWRAKDLVPGRRGLFAGKVSTFRSTRQLAHPDFELIEGDGDARAEEFAARPIPVYPATKGLNSWGIAKCVAAALDSRSVGDDPLPDMLRRKRGLIKLPDAYEKIHRPHDKNDIRRSRDRLKWDEAFVLQVALAQRRRAALALPATPRVRVENGLLGEFDQRLPFELTAGQRQVGDEIAADLAREHPMHRLLQGDVGSGKTIVALRAMLQVVDAGAQAVMLAPTEVLAQQHHRSITSLLGPLAQAGQIGGADHGTRVALLTGSQGAKARRAASLDAAAGAAGIVVGTHALLQEHVQFADLGLVVVDEQHRFGVEQRDALREKATGGRPHVLVMTATPIPRTVAMTVYGDLDTSALTQLPAGRSPIATHVVPAGHRRFWDRTWERILEEVGKGHQAYVVCPRIGEAEGDEGDMSADRTDQGEDARLLLGGEGPPGLPLLQRHSRQRRGQALGDLNPLAQQPLVGRPGGLLEAATGPDRSTTREAPGTSPPPRVAPAAGWRSPEGHSGDVPVNHPRG